MRQLNYRGVSMVEVLVAIVVLAVGLLGTATLFVTSMQSKKTAESRMQAVNLAADIADRIRANGAGRLAYGLSDTATPTAPSTTNNCIQNTNPAVTCTPALMAAADLYEWSNAISNTLPGTIVRRITVTDQNATTPAVYNIFLQWTEPSLGTLSHSLQVQLCHNC